MDDFYGFFYMIIEFDFLIIFLFLDGCELLFSFFRDFKRFISYDLGWIGFKI